MKFFCWRSRYLCRLRPRLCRPKIRSAPAIRARGKNPHRPAGTSRKDRTLADYKQTVAAYQKVYLITPQAEEVTPALIAEAELYQQMARQFDEKIFQSAIDTYNFLLKQYPETRYPL